ncbi:MAG TPA: tetratricopeptide repeat protein [Geobacterales bacterium]|nr:tetratricopeptide repeat protein [Geobacterales bacterium]
MGLFSRFFRRDLADEIKSAERLMADGQWAEARQTFMEALELAAEEGIFTERGRVEKLRDECSRHLALLNLEEAKNWLAADDTERAFGHLEMVLELTNDPLLRQMAMDARRISDKMEASKSAPLVISGCTGCGSGISEMTEPPPAELHELNWADRFELHIHGLPADLRQQYVKMGEEFAKAAMLAHGGDQRSALPIFEGLLVTSRNDILLYETALAHHALGNNDACEKLLREALGENPDNPLVWLALVQFLLQQGADSEGEALLRSMIDKGIFVDQGRMMLADLCLERGDRQEAMRLYSALMNGAEAKSAAERLIPLLLEEGRQGEAAVLVRKYASHCR